MQPTRLPMLALALASAGLLACSEALTPVPVSDTEITEDIASSAGDAIATALELMSSNENAGPLPSVTSASGEPVGEVAAAVTLSRTLTCFDAQDAAMSSCSPMSAVRKLVTRTQMGGNRSGTRVIGERTVTWSGRISRVSNDTVVRNFSPSVEVSRTHTGLIVGNDTTTFSDSAESRIAVESSVDSVRALTWRVPRFQNPYPISGSVVRNVSVRVMIVRDGRRHEHSVTRRLSVRFPADAQGNVTLTIATRDCTLNLVTHRVTGCSPS